MSKTPVSTLQEYMQKNKLGTPEYVIIAETNGTHLASFTYRVNCGTFSAQGTASSKKEAKHNAARELLKLLPDCNRNIELSPRNASLTPPKINPVDSYYSPGSNGISHNDVFVNSVGKLNEHCSARRLKVPEYTVVEMNGPSHKMTFTMKCSIGNLSATATASTKKQAKHDAAQNMYQLLVKTTTSKTDFGLHLPEELKQCYVEGEMSFSNVEVLELKMPQLSLSSEKSAEKAMELFPKLRSCDSATIVKDVPIEHYHNALKLSVPPATGNKAQEKIRSSSIISNAEMVLNGVLELLNLKLKCQVTESLVDQHVFRCSVNSSPALIDVGIGKTVAEAKEKAIKNMLSSIERLLC